MAGKDEFLQQLANIVEGIGKNKEALEHKKEGEKAKLDDVTEQLAALVEKKRLYYKMVKEFQNECKKNDLLTSQLQQWASRAFCINSVNSVVIPC